jgi:outer membrane protein OmpA-like peptidoglycan-associated protein
MPNNQMRLLLLALPFLFASKCRDRNKGAITEDVVDVVRPESTIQVTGITPDSIDAGTTPVARISGTGFKKEADVFIGGQQVFGVDFVSTNSLKVTLPSLSPGMYDVRVNNNNGQSHTGYGVLEVSLASAAQEIPMKCREEIVILFDVNKFSVEGSGQYALREFGQCFEVEGATYTVEGHCDERGTTEYNLALGERRADAAEAFLKSKGISSSRITTKSYGEERPVARGAGESAWAQNRRAVIQIRYP